MQILTPEGILSYPNLVQPKVNQLDPDKKKRYSADIIFPKGTDISKLKKAVESVASEKGLPLKKCKLALKSCADVLDEDTGNVKALYNQGDYYITAWAGEDHKPNYVGPQRETDYPAIRFKGGNLVSFIINLWAFDKSANKGVSAGLMAVQWRGEGSPVTPEANINLFEAAEVEDLADDQEDAPENPFGE